MGKSEEKNGNTIQVGESTFLTKTSSEASKMLEAALLQMDDIISGKLYIILFWINLIYQIYNQCIYNNKIYKIYKIINIYKNI